MKYCCDYECCDFSYYADDEHCDCKDCFVCGGEIREGEKLEF